jgi:hypothetical protein
MRSKVGDEHIGAVLLLNCFSRDAVSRHATMAAIALARLSGHSGR